MTSQELDKFEAQVMQMKPRVRKLFLAGKITLEEAQTFSERSRLDNQRLHSRVDQLHQKRHADLLREHACVPSELDVIATVYASIDQLVNDMCLLPPHITKLVLYGKLTLLQARYANFHRLGRKKLRVLHRMNNPAVPYREVKYALGTEHSLRAPVRVRPRSRYAHISNR